MGFWSERKRRKEYAAAQIAAEAKAKVDPKRIVEQAIQKAQDQHNQMDGLVARVTANQRAEEARLRRFQDQADELTAQVRDALAEADEEAARTYAEQLASLRQKIAVTAGVVEQCGKDAADAHDKLLLSQQILSEARTRKEGLLSGLSHAEMEQKSAELLAGTQEAAAVLNGVEETISEREAHAAGLAEVGGLSPEGAQVTLQHDEDALSADAILAELAPKAEPHPPASPNAFGAS